MSDKNHVAHALARREEDLAAMRKGFEAGITGYAYVAEPAPGFDAPGIFTCFGATYRTGYAHLGYGLTLALEAMGLPVKVIPHRMMDIDADLLPPERYEAVSKWMVAPIGIGELLVVVMPPMECAQMRGLGRYLVGYSTHECDRVSAEAAACASGLDMLWTQSSFAADAFERGGVPRSQIRVLDPPLLGGPWKATARAPRQSASSERAPYRFGMVGQWIPRKGFESLIRAYYGAFKRAEDPVRLCIRTSPFGGMAIADFDEVVRKKIYEIRAEWRGRTEFPVISVQTGTEMGDQALIDWISDLDCFVNSSFGEGVGVPQIYAMAAGVPLLTTAFGAVGETLRELEVEAGVQHDFVPHALVPIDREQLRVNRIYDYRQRWGVYEPVALAERMRTIALFQIPKRDASALARIAEGAQRKFGLERFIARMGELLPEVLDKEISERWLAR